MKPDLIHFRVRRRSEKQLRDQQQATSSVALLPPLSREHFEQSNELNSNELEMLFELQQAMACFANEYACQRTIDYVPSHEHTTIVPSGIYVRQTVQFCKQLPTFCRLTEDDQLCLLKALYPELSAIRIAYTYDSVQNTYPVFVVRILSPLAYFDLI